MFVFRQDEIDGRERKAVPANKFFSDGVLEQTKSSDNTNSDPLWGSPRALNTIQIEQKEHFNPIQSGCDCCFHFSSALDPSVSTENSSELSSFSPHSDAISVNWESNHTAVALSDILYKPSFDSPFDRLLRATDRATPKRQALEIFHQFHTWATIEAQVEIIQIYSSEIHNQAIPKLFEYIRLNVNDNECVSEALVLIETLTSLSFDERKSSSKGLMLVQAGAVDSLFLALIAHNNDTNRAFDAASANTIQDHKPLTCLFQRLWNFLIEIALSPSSVQYFQTDPKRELQKHHERIKILAAVDLCLDRILHSSFEFPTLNHQQCCYMNQVLKTLVMLLCFRNKDGTKVPNKTIRFFVWEKQSIIKCQQTMANRMDQAAEWRGQEQREREHELIGDALELFQMCLSDCNDNLSESIDPDFLENFVYHVLPKFPTSVSIQTKGWQILDDVSSRRNEHDLSPAEQTLVSLGSTTNDNEYDKENQTSGSRSLEKSVAKDKASVIDLVESVFPDPAACLCDDNCQRHQNHLMLEVTNLSSINRK